ncbi:MAG: membrane protein insertion efficiency factor YidD [Desulfuromonadaceae bacterium]|nr:membrane protein insertion efficiency factor YidD [Desulfuromonas sp.]MDY0184919.1 membrane protein insertion efficiency factor YidD [Desulfuromonadaceae bacterium]
MSKCLIALVHFYQIYISPCKLPCCRFVPTCSEYSIQALERYGVIKGIWLSCIRILKCNPLFKGGYDPLK